MIAAIILSAGTSTRMGRPKALLELEGKTLLQRAIDNCQSASIESIVVVLGGDAEAIQAASDLSATTCVINTEFHLGQTSSVQTGLQAIPANCEALLLYPVDYGRVTAADVDALLQVWRQTPATVIQPVFEGRRGHPVLLSAALFSDMAALSTESGVNEVTGAHRADTQYVDVDNPWVCHDLDTPEDYSKACLK